MQNLDIDEIELWRDASAALQKQKDFRDLDIFSCAAVGDSGGRASKMQRLYETQCEILGLEIRNVNSPSQEAIEATRRTLGWVD